jgi:hypothetical protein
MADFTRMSCDSRLQLPDRLTFSESDFADGNRVVSRRAERFSERLRGTRGKPRERTRRIQMAPVL